MKLREDEYGVSLIKERAKDIQSRRKTYLQGLGIICKTCGQFTDISFKTMVLIPKL